MMHWDCMKTGYNLNMMIPVYMQSADLQIHIQEF
jgi:hypothetical protein